MPENSIVVENVSKFYEVYKKPSHRLYQMLSRGRRNFFEPFWALKDISFTVEKGDCLAIIGRNGAGKSTLLQIISGILSPTTGTVSVNGRIGALLELGSGFNPEFSGRENIFLNASILGLSPREISERFDSIVEFSGIGEEFIQQQVKTYSSGMALRLAFAVMAHIDAEILIIDEALSVGDAFFTQKCMRFLRNFMRDHTVIFVSHDTGAVNSLCSRAILLEGGRIKRMGSPKEITETYLADLYEEQQGVRLEKKHACRDGAPPLPQPDGNFGDMRMKFINSSNLRNDIEVFKFNEDSEAFGLRGAEITDAKMLDDRGQPLAWIVGGESVILRVLVRANTDIQNPIVGFFLKNRHGQNIFGDNTFLTYCGKNLKWHAGDTAEATFSFVMPILERGDYSMSIAVAEGTQDEHVQHDWKHEALMFRSVTTSCHTGLVGVPMRNISLRTL